MFKECNVYIHVFIEHNYLYIKRKNDIYNS